MTFKNVRFMAVFIRKNVQILIFLLGKNITKEFLDLKILFTKDY